MLWRAVRYSIRALIRFVPHSALSQQAARLLRAEIGNTRTPEGTLSEPWRRYQLRLRRDILTKDPRGFLNWDVIAETMSPPPYARFVRPEVQFLRTHNWAIWSHAIGREGTGAASPCLFYPAASSNAIHQAYHLCRFEAETAMRIAEFDLILEFGGGYGEMRRIADKVGFRGKYVIFDLPELSALQRYYLSASGNPSTVTVSDHIALRAAVQAEPEVSRKLLVATWSFDEMPLESRQEWTDLLAGFDAFLIAFQAEFEGIDNRAFFAHWQKQFPRISFSAHAIPQVWNSFYLFGCRAGG